MTMQEQDWWAEPLLELEDSAELPHAVEQIAERAASRDVAVIGMSVRVPQAESSSELWRLLRNGTDAVGEFPHSRRTDAESLLADTRLPEGEASYYDGAYLERIDAFDHRFFRLSPKEAALMSPNQRLWLETAWQAIEDAGYGGDRLRGTRTGVYLGYNGDSFHDYKRLIAERDPASLSLAIPGNLSAVTAGRLSYLLDLAGPSMAVDTACSSSLVALHLAVQSIRAGECDQAIVGGVKTYLLPVDLGIRIGIESPDARARTFDASSEGTGGGEGTAAVVLKPLDLALKDGDAIHAVIRGSAINQDGASIGLTAPNARAQEAVIAAAWEDAGIDPETIGYIEAHGTGTKLGDPIEAAGIANAFRRYTQRRQFCAVGSVKTNIGHLDTAAGIVGLVKTILMLKHAQIPPLVHFRTPNPEIPFERSPLYVPTELQPWPRAEGGQPYRAGVSSFGMSGTNAHVVLEEAPRGTAWAEGSGEGADSEALGPYIVTLSAKSRTALRALLQQYTEWLQQEAAALPPLSGISRTSLVGRGHYGWRAAVLAGSHEELRTKLKQLMEALDGLPLAPVPGMAAEREGAWLGAPRNGEDEPALANGTAYEDGSASALCRQYAHGAAISWDRLAKDLPARTVHMPVYPFDRIRCWIEDAAGSNAIYRKPGGLASSGSVDRAKTEAAAGSTAAPERKRVVLAGRADNRYSHAEQLAAEAWAEALGLAEIGVDEDFYEAGGDSILALRAARALELATGTSISAVDIMMQPTVAELASFLEDQLSPEQLAATELAADASLHSGDNAAAAPAERLLPLSRAQRRIYLNGHQPGAELHHHMTLAYAVSGAVDADRLEEAFAELVRRHEALRTTFEWSADGEPVQRIHAAAPFQLERGQIDAESVWQDYVQSFVRPFDAEQLPLLRVGLASSPTGSSSLLVLDAHHLILDGASLAMLLGELIRLYEGQPLLPVAAQYADYVRRQIAWLDSEEKAAQRSYWLDRTLSGPLPKLTLPLDRHRPARKSMQGGSYRAAIPADVVRSLNRTAASCKASAHAMLLAAFGLLLGRYAGQDELIVGSLVNGREDSDLHGAAGVFINFVPIRLNLVPTMTGEALLRAVHDASTAAYANGRYPFDELAAELGELSDRSRSPVYDAMLVFHNHAAGGEAFEAGGLSFKQLPLARASSSLDIKLDVFITRSGELQGVWEYDTALFEERTIIELAERFTALCESLSLRRTGLLQELFGFSDAEEAELDVRRARNRVQNAASTQLPVEQEKRRPFRLHVASTFTAEPLKPHLSAWLRQFGWMPEITFAPYNQVMQDLLNPIPPSEGADSYSDGSAARLLLIRPEDWLGEGTGTGTFAAGAALRQRSQESRDERLEDDLARLTSLLAERPDRLPVIIGLAPPGALQHMDDAERAALVASWHERWRGLAESAAVSIVDFAETAQRYFVDAIEDSVTEAEGHIPYTEQYFAAMAAQIARELAAGSGSPFKVIAVDADQTLWRGVCGEDGAEGVAVTEGFAALQRRLLRARSEGMLLVLCSKNDEADVWDVFERNPGMLLEQEHFAAWRINWNAKPDNLRELAKELNVGIDSFVFLDDNAAECLAMMAAQPEVLTIKVPDAVDDGEMALFVQHLWALDRVRVTEDDRRRADRYGEERLRKQAASTMATMEQYLASLDIQVCVRPVRPADLARASQLTYRTNQFNAGGGRLAEEQLHELMDRRQAWVVEATDRYGDYGLIGLVSAAAAGEDFAVNAFMLSCRVLGRGIEHAVLDRLAGIAAERGCMRIKLPFAETAKNMPFAAFLRQLPGGSDRAGNDPLVIELHDMIAAPAHIALLSEPKDPQESQEHRNEPYKMSEHTAGGSPQACSANAVSDSFVRSKSGAGPRSDWSFMPDEGSARHRPYLLALRYTHAEALVAFAKAAALDADNGVTANSEANVLLGETEQTVAELWREVLGSRASIGRSSTFFEAGGDSLQAASLVSGIVRRFGVRLSLSELFVNARLDEIVRLIESKRRLQASDLPDSVTAPGTGWPAAPFAERYPVTSAQKRMYILQQLDPEGTSYHIPTVLELRGALDVEKLAGAIRALIQRHEALRTSFALHGGEPVQIIAPPQAADAFALPLDRIRLDAGESIDDAARRFVRPFDLAESPLMRTALVETADNAVRYLLFDIHHIVADGVSVNVLLEEAIRLYAGEELAPLPSHFKDYAVWQIRREQEPGRSESCDGQMRMWKSRLGGSLPKLELPLDFDRPAVMSRSGIRADITLDPALTDKLHALARRQETTPFMVLLAAYGVWLMRLSGQQDIVVGAPVAGRAAPGTERFVGLFVNTLPIRMAPRPELAFEQLLQEAKAAALEAIAGQEVPFDQLVDQLLPPMERELGRNPLFDAMFSMLNMPHAELSSGELQARQLDVDFGTAQVDVGMSAIQRGDAMHLTFQYDAGLFSRSTMDRWTGIFSRLLRQIVEAPHNAVGSYDLLDEAERDKLLRFNATAVDQRLESMTLHECFRRQARLSPDRTAAVFDAETLTYRELDARSDKLAERLRALGVRRGDAVGLMAERSPAMMAGMLAILKAGGAYVPLPPDFPAERLRFMMEDSGLQVACVQHKWLADAITALPGATLAAVDDAGHAAADEHLPSEQRTDGTATHAGRSEDSAYGCEEVTAGDLAYILFTSGSTGRPKGVMIRHGAVMNRIGWMQRAYPLERGDAILQKTPISFDVSVWELFWWMLAGASAVFIAPGAEKDPERLLQVIETQGITTIHFVPSMLAAFVEAAQEVPAAALRTKLRTLKRAFASGEALQPSHADRFYALMERSGNAGARLVNLYGPTEATVDVTVFECEPGSKLRTVPIGRPIDNTSAYVVNASGQLQPIGVPGELCVGGVQVAVGYANRPELTAERFVTDPYSGIDGARLYRTGDLARWTEEGVLEYLGRIDGQIKIRGHRIELGEIERALLAYEPLSEAVVTVVKDGAGTSSLCAYVVADRPCTAGELRRHCSKLLPSYMLPEAFVQLAAMPLTASGKADRKALPHTRGEAALATGAAYAEPTTDTEKAIAAIWKGLLVHETIGLDDEFFELGGNSLKAVAMNARIEKELGVRLELQALFNNTTIRALSERIHEAAGMPGYSSKPFPKAPEQPFYPASAAQQRMILHQQLQPGSLSYHMTTVLWCEGGLDGGAIHRALDGLVSMHDSLRTSFDQRNGEAVQTVHRAVERLPLTIWEKGEFAREYGLNDEAMEETIDRWLNRWRKPFPLRQAPLFRLDAVPLSDAAFLLLFDIHHAVSDGVSAIILMQDLAALYEGKSVDAPIVQMRDYTEWLRAGRTDGRMDEARQWWLRQFEGGVPSRRLPLDRPRASLTAANADDADALVLKLDRKRAGQMRITARRYGCTPFMFLLAAYQAAYSWWTEEESAAIGIPIAGRSHPDLQRTTGLLLNVAPLIAEAPPSWRFEQLLSDVKERLAAAIRYSDYPSEWLVEELDDRGLIAWEAARHPLFDTLFAMQESGGAPKDAGGFNWRPVEHPARAAKLDLAVQAEETADGGVELIIEYRSGLFRAETVQRLADCMDRVLQGATASPEAELGALTALQAPTAAAAASSMQGEPKASPGQSTKLFEDSFDF